MILIADSGSTKTEWRLLDKNSKVNVFHTAGFNPYVQSAEHITLELQHALLPQILQHVQGKKFELFFYGAGCSSEANCSLVKNCLLAVFPKAEVHIEHDLLAAARALCGKAEGIAAILGTGSNTCYYDGNKIVKNIPALGYVLGDEGSGASIGKKLVASLLYEEMPALIREKFYSALKLNKESILDAVYKQANPNRFLASFMPFIQANLQDIFFMELVSSSFNEFFDRHICRYPKHREVLMGCVGSVGFHFSEILKQVASAKGVRLGKIIKSPIEELVEYHKNAGR